MTVEAAAWRRESRLGRTLLRIGTVSAYVAGGAGSPCERVARGNVVEGHAAECGKVAIHHDDVGGDKIPNERDRDLIAIDVDAGFHAKLARVQAEFKVADGEIEVDARDGLGNRTPPVLRDGFRVDGVEKRLVRILERERVAHPRVVLPLKFALERRARMFDNVHRPSACVEEALERGPNRPSRGSGAVG